METFFEKVEQFAEQCAQEYVIRFIFKLTLGYSRMLTLGETPNSLNTWCWPIASTESRSRLYNSDIRRH
jgi:hypothetical protein